MSEGEGLSAQQVERIKANPTYRSLVRRRMRLALWLTAIMLAAFFGFTLAVAFDKEALATPIGNGVTSVGIPIGFAIILLAIVLTGIYVRRANREFDLLTDELRRELEA